MKRTMIAFLLCGCLASSGRADARRDFSAEIAACSAKGGGRVVVPAGVWRTGKVHLRSNVELHLEKGAVLRFSDDPRDYLPAVRTSWEGVECYNYSPLIYAYGATNVAITGEGRLEAEMGTWRQWGGNRSPQAEAAKLKLVREWGPNDVPVGERDLTKLPGSNLRPPFIGLNGCRGVRLEGFTLRDSPFWCIHMLNCDGVTLRRLDVKADINNSDGANFESTRNVLVEDCVFDQGDDIVCCKSGLDRDGRRRGTPTENVLVRRCVAKRGHGLFTMGSECSGGIRNVTMEDCRIEGECNNLLNVKTRETRGGFVENVTLRRIRADSLRVAAVTVTTRNDAWARYQDGLEKSLTRIDGITVEDLSVKKAYRRLSVLGDPDLPVRNVRIRNVRAEEVEALDEIEFADVADADKGESIRMALSDGKVREMDRADVAKALGFPQQFCDRKSRTVGQSAFDTVYNEVVRADLAADEKWRSLKTPDEIRAHQRDVRAAAVKAMGGFPERTPLNPVVVGTVRCGGYTVERLYFESRPKFYVTAHLFLPDPEKFKGPHPGVILPCGHTWEGKMGDAYQRGSMLAARAGLAVLIYDPIDQGERYQRRPRPANWGTCEEHNRLGVRAHLVGSSAAMWRLWDGMRAIDYLSSRSDIDPDRIGVMGQSGGGTLTSLVMAFDDRVKAAAPSSYLSTIRAVGALCGPQDAEQNVYGQLRFGLNHLGLVALRAPSPVMIVATHTDFFPFFGTIETYAGAQSVFGAFGAKGDVWLSEAEGGHGWCESQRQASVRWMRRHLLGDRTADPTALAELRRTNVGFDLERAEAGVSRMPSAVVAPDGWAMNLPDARSDYEIVGEEAAALAAKSGALTAGAVRAATGIRPLAELGCTRIGDTLVREDLTRIPTVTFRPERPDGLPPVLLVSDARDRRELADAVFARTYYGRTVMVAELRAFGETGANRPARRWGFYGSKDGDEELAVTMIWLGESLVARRAEDVAVAAKALSDACGGAKVEILAQGRAAIPAAHAYYLEPDLFSGIVFDRKPSSWKAVLEDPDLACGFADAVYGALRTYDWTDLVRAR